MEPDAPVPPTPPEGTLSPEDSIPAVAKKGDRVLGLDVHLVIPPSGGPPVPTPLKFDGKLASELSEDVMADDQPIAIVGSVADNEPAHVPPAGAFAKQPSNKGKVIVGSKTVFANDKPVARAGDLVETCNDPVDAPTAVIVARGTVLSGS